MAKGTTYGESHDMNDHLLISLPQGTKAIVMAKSPDGTWQPAGIAEFKPGQSLCALKAP